MKSIKTISAFAMAFVAFGATAQVTLHFHERPPYVFLKDGQLTGLTGSPAANAFKDAGIQFTVASTPAARQLATFKEGAGLDCGVNWLKTTEREGFGKYTKPIYQSQPLIALTSAKNTKLKNGDNVEAVLGNKSINLLLKQGYSLGNALDAMLAKLKPTITSVTVESMAMLKMIHADRVDFMFAAPEEADTLIASSGLSSAEFRKVSLSNMPKGENRYIFCSKKVPDEIIEKLNRAITH